MWASGFLYGGGEACGAAIVGAAEHDGGLEGGVLLEGGYGLEELAADFEVFFTDLLLQGDGVAGDDKGSPGVDGVEESGDEVGEAFANAGSGLEEEGRVGFEGVGDGSGHVGLRGAVLEAEGFLEVAAGPENGIDLVVEVAGPGGCAGVFC